MKKLQQEFNAEDFIVFFNKFTKMIEEKDYIKTINWIDCSTSELYFNTEIINFIYKELAIIEEHNTYEHNILDIIKRPQLGYIRRICSLDFINYTKQRGCDKLDERMYKISFEHFLIREYQPAGIIIIVDEKEESSLAHYATEHGIPNCQYKAKFINKLSLSL